MTSSPHGLYAQGCTRATMVVQSEARPRGGANRKKHALSSDCRLQLACMKLESLVIAYQHDAVNVFLSLVHTARQVMEAGSTRSRLANLTEAAADGELGDWD
jgi:hypothetical protein